MITAEIENCGPKVKFSPKIIYPGKYFVSGRCFLMERVTGSNQLVKVQINGDDINQLTAKCLNDGCSLREK